MIIYHVCIYYNEVKMEGLLACFGFEGPEHQACNVTYIHSVIQGPNLSGGGFVFFFFFWGQRLNSSFRDLSPVLYLIFFGYPAKAALVQLSVCPLYV